MEEVNLLSYREPTDGNAKYPGAIKKNKHVLAVMRDNKSWEIAQIMDVRPSIIASQWQPTNQMQID